MDKNQFISLLQRYADSSLSEAEQIISLKEQYPYSQLLHTLSAKVTHDHQLASHQKELQVAAIRASDRAVLKEIINTIHSAVTLPEKVETITVAEVQRTEVRTIQRQSVETAGSDVADELMRDMEKLNSLKHNFEMMFVEYSEVQPKKIPAEDQPEPVEPQAPVKAREVIVEEKTARAEVNVEPEPGPPKRKVPKAKSNKSKKQRIIELAKKMNKNSDGSNEKESRSAKKGQSDALIEEIIDKKKEIRPESEKQKEQMEIINQFIKTQPSISNAKERALAMAGDLNPIKTGEFGDNIVSETLVEILVKQGKKDKAIEVLKKLIWKYPQKKAYFASQIEDLKK